MRRLLILLIPLMLFAASCGSNLGGPTKEQLIQIAVAQTLSSLPRNTPAPPPSPYPTFTPVALSGIFCEYQFCIGHPADMAFYDVSAAQSQGSPSSYSRGILAAYNSSLFIQLIWQDAPGVTDPQFMIDLMLQQGGDTRSGDIQPELVGPLNVYAAPITPMPGAASTLPAGEVAAWVCGGRAFAWKVYAPQQETAATLLADSLARFRCESK
jgi:hypothetical protein